MMKCASCGIPFEGKLGDSCPKNCHEDSPYKKAAVAVGLAVLLDTALIVMLHAGGIARLIWTQ